MAAEAAPNPELADMQTKVQSLMGDKSTQNSPDEFQALHPMCI